MSMDLDIGPLSWVKGEIDLALERAASELAAHVADPAGKGLANAQASLHQANGALAIVGLDGVMQFSEAIEHLFAALADGKVQVSEAFLAAANGGLAALRHHLDGLMGGETNQPLKLLPAFRAMALAAGQPDPGPAALFFPDLTQRPPRRETEPAALDGEALAKRLKMARMAWERGLLKWIKGDAKGAGEMKLAVGMIEGTRQQPADRAFWWVLLGVLDAAAAGGLPEANDAKKLMMKAGGQIKKLAEGHDEVPEALLREALYQAAVATAGGEQLGVVRAAYRLADMIPREGGGEAARLAPVLRRMRELIGGAKESWNQLCAGTMAALPAFQARATDLATATAELGDAEVGGLAASVQAVADALRRDPSRHTESLGLELATGLLLLESPLDTWLDLDAAARGDFGQQAAMQAGRLDALMRGEALDAQDLPHLDAMSRRAQERLLLATVAKEIAANLATVEQTLDAYFRDPARRDTLAALNAPLKQIEGALAVLGQDRAGEVLRECEAQVQAFAAAATTPAAAEFEDVAAKFSALGFFVEKLQHGNADIDAILGRPAPAPEPEPAPEAEAVPPAPTLAEPEPEPAPQPAAAAEPGSDVDAELLDIFLEEAREVLLTIGEQLPRLHAAPGDAPTLTTLRRSVHTLKGSGRMVGLNELGEVAWGLEQVLNRWLQDGREATPELLATLDEASSVFGDWVAQLDAGGASHYEAGHLIQDCQVLLGEAEAPVAAMAPAAQQDAVAEAAVAPAPTPEPEPEPEPAEPEPEPPAAEAEAAANVLEFPAPPPVLIGDLEVAPTLYALYLEEARDHVATLQRPLDPDAPPAAEFVRAAHTLASISAAAGIQPVRTLAHALEIAFDRHAEAGAVAGEATRFAFARAIGALEGMVGAIAERRMPADEATLAAELASVVPAPPVEPVELVEPPPPQPHPETAVEAPAEAPATADGDEGSSLTDTANRRQKRLADDIDAQLLPLFLEESVDLMTAIGESLRGWRAQPGDGAIAQKLQRELHTLKGSARMAGALGIGELLHSMETRVEQAAAMRLVDAIVFDGLETSHDRAAFLIENLRKGPAAVAPAPTSGAPATAPAAEVSKPAAPADAEPPRVAQAVLRVRADLVDRLVNEAGEVAIARARIEGEMRALKTSLRDLTENVIRLRGQLREIEIQAESQMQAQTAQVQEQGVDFDPLEFDRFSRFQELTRFMAESVNDVSTIQHGLLRNLDHAQAALAAQARLNRDLSQSLMGVRMVPFNAIAERLHRVVRQAAKECGCRANLDIRGGQLELDRSVLDKMTGPLEHLLRNAVAHGIGNVDTRRAAGKDELGEISITIAQEGNEVVIAIADDGNGLDLDRIRERGLERGLIDYTSVIDDRALANLIFVPGFSTATAVTQTAGRGVGMDVVKNETAELGGRIEVSTEAGRGCTFRLYLPLTLAVTQAVLVQAGGRTYAIPATMVEQASELKPDAIGQIRLSGETQWMGKRYPWHYLPQLLGDAGAQPQPMRRHWVVLVRGGADHVAIEVDGLVGNQEIVLKNIGPQLARVPGLAGATVLGDGTVVLILNPIALTKRAEEQSQRAMTHTHIGRGPAAALTDTQISRDTPQAPTIMVVDDSLTVRKITSRLLARQGWQVLTAKDGLDGIEQLADAPVDVLLVDIEMPRMDGFEFTRSVRADARLRHIPIIMITSRTADKHRNHALEIGVNHYLGKPFDEEQLLGLVRNYVENKT